MENPSGNGRIRSRHAGLTANTGPISTNVVRRAVERRRCRVMTWLAWLSGAELARWMAKIVDDKLGGRLAKLGESGELRGDRGETVLLHLNGELEAPRLVTAGVGKRDDVDADALRTAGATTGLLVA